MNGPIWVKHKGANYMLMDGQGMLCSRCDHVTRVHAHKPGLVFCGECDRYYPAKRKRAYDACGKWIGYHEANGTITLFEGNVSDEGEHS